MNFLSKIFFLSLNCYERPGAQSQTMSAHFSCGLGQVTCSMSLNQFFSSINEVNIFSTSRVVLRTENVREVFNNGVDTQTSLSHIALILFGSRCRAVAVVRPKFLKRTDQNRVTLIPAPPTWTGSERLASQRLGPWPWQISQVCSPKYTSALSIPS